MIINISRLALRAFGAKNRIVVWNSHTAANTPTRATGAHALGPRALRGSLRSHGARSAHPHRAAREPSAMHGPRVRFSWAGATSQVATVSCNNDQTPGPGIRLKPKGWNEKGDG
jgi:hypothetical protein